MTGLLAAKLWATAVAVTVAGGLLGIATISSERFQRAAVTIYCAGFAAMVAVGLAWVWAQ